MYVDLFFLSTTSFLLNSLLCFLLVYYTFIGSSNTFIL